MAAHSLSVDGNAAGVVPAVVLPRMAKQRCDLALRLSWMLDNEPAFRNAGMRNGPRADAF